MEKERLRISGVENERGVSVCRQIFTSLALTGFRTQRQDAPGANGPLAVAALSQWAQRALLFTINRLVTWN